MRTPLRIALIVAGAILFVVGAYQSQGPPRLTLLNTGLAVQHGLRHPAGALLAAGPASSPWRPPAAGPAWSSSPWRPSAC